MAATARGTGSHTPQIFNKIKNFKFTKSLKTQLYLLIEFPAQHKLRLRALSKSSFGYLGESTDYDQTLVYDTYLPTCSQLKCKPK